MLASQNPLARLQRSLTHCLNWANHSKRGLYESTLLLIGLAFQLIQAPVNIASDGAIRFQALTDLLQNGTLSHTKYSLIGPLCSAPLWLLGKVIRSPEAITSRYNLILFITALLTMYWLLRHQLDHNLLRAFFLILLVASLFTNQLPSYNAEVFTALCVAVGILAAVYRPSLPAWGLIILGVINTPASLIGLACLACTHLFTNKKWRYLLAPLIALTLIALEAWLRRGSPLTSGYATDHGNPTILPYSGRPAFSYPFFFGLLSILFSFGKGLLYFAPGLLLPMKKSMLNPDQPSTSSQPIASDQIIPSGPPTTSDLSDPSVQPAAQHLHHIYRLWLAFLIGLILIYAQWWAWYGGWSWGPRFFLFASLPASLALAIRLQRPASSLLANLLTLALLALSFWVGIVGATFGQHGLDICTQNHYAQEFLCHYIPEFSVLWHPFVAPTPLRYGQWAYIAYSLLVFASLAAPLARIIARQTLAHVRTYRATAFQPGAWRF
jgi:hypothetical protein